jgi:ppGpp synthetase/RelA/SpoT-type nucleotidyltranferase
MTSDVESSPFELNATEITKTYNSVSGLYEALLEEATFILRERIVTEQIKLHNVESRVKELPSLLSKCARKNC